MGQIINNNTNNKTNKPNLIWQRRFGIKNQNERVAPLSTSTKINNKIYENNDINMNIDDLYIEDFSENENMNVDSTPVISNGRDLGNLSICASINFAFDLFCL